MDFLQYKNKKKILQQCFSQSEKLAHSLQIIDVEKKLCSEKKQLEKEKFTVVVVGEFSRGKSTFVNAMMGKKILPSSKEPTTNIINKIVYGENPAYTLYYKNNTTKDITKKEFDHIKAQSEKNKVEKVFHVACEIVDNIKKPVHNENPFSNIQYAKITYPLDFCQNNVEVVDTPGTNDLNRARIEITYEYLNQAEAAILILGADQALSKSELTFLKERVLGNHIKDVFIVINYKDQLNSNDEEQKVLQYVTHHINDLGDFSNKIFMVSSKQALLYRREKNGELLKPKEQLSLPLDFEETGFPAFESALTKFLDTEKGNAKIQKYLQFLFQYLNDIEQIIQGRIKKLDYGLVELQKELAIEKPKYEKIRYETNRLTDYLESKLMLRGKDVGQQADIYASQIKRAAMISVDDMRENMNEKEIQELIESAVTPVQKRLIESINKLQRDSISEEITPIINELQKIWDNMNFDMELVSFDTKGPNKNIALQFTNIDDNNEDRWTGALISFTIAGLLGVTGLGLLAAGVFGWFVGDSGTEDISIKLKQQIREQYDKAYLGYGDKIEEEYEKIAKKICQNIKQEVNSRLDTMEQQLNILIDSKRNKEEDNSIKKNVLSQQLQEIEDMKVKLRRLNE